MWIEADIAYLAGIIDGEGSILIVKGSLKGRVTWNSSISIANSSLDLLEWIQSVFGGALRHTRTPMGKKFYILEWTNDRGREIALAIKPYIKLKYVQCSLFLEYLDCKKEHGHHGCKGLSTIAFNSRNELWDTMKDMNEKKQGFFVDGFRET